METIILAAGRGTRCWPYGETCPKAALPVANRPLIQFLADAARSAGAASLTVVVGHLAGQVRAALVDQPDIRYVTQPEPTGAADAVMLALGESAPDELLVLYGDVFLTTADLQNLRAALAAEPEAAAAVLVATLDGEDPRDWLCAGTESGRLTKVQGHPRSGSHRLGGAFLLRPAALPFVAANPGTGVRVPVGGMPPLEAELAESLNLLLDRGKLVLAVNAGPWFVDVDKPWHLLTANRRAGELLFEGVTEPRLDPTAEVSPHAEIDGLLIAAAGARIGPRVRIKGPCYVGSNALVDNGAILSGGVLIGPDAVVADYCRVDTAVIGPRCRVTHGAELSGVLMEGCCLVHYLEFSGILGRHSDLGAATVCGTLRFDDGVTEQRVNGRRERPRSGGNASYLGDYTRTGVNAILMPGVKVGAYSLVGPGVVLTEDLPSHTSRLLRQEYDDRPWGPERYGW